MDTTILGLYLLDGAVLTILVLLLLGLRAFGRTFNELPKLVGTLADGFLWETIEETDAEGKKVVVRKPSAQFAGVLQAAVPLVISEGMKWAQKNIKMGPAVGAGGLQGLLGGGGIGKALGLKKGMAELVDAFAPGLIQRFMPGFLGGGAKPPEGGVSTNPFLNQK